MDANVLSLMACRDNLSISQSFIPKVNFPLLFFWYMQMADARQGNSALQNQPKLNCSQVNNKVISVSKVLIV